MVDPSTDAESQSGGWKLAVLHADGESYQIESESIGLHEGSLALSTPKDTLMAPCIDNMAIESDREDDEAEKLLLYGSTRSSQDSWSAR